MKTIEQLLKLSENPYYKLLPEEQEVLDNFLSQKREAESKQSRSSGSKKSSKNTHAIVRNVVKKTIPKIEEAE